MDPSRTDTRGVSGSLTKEDMVCNHPPLLQVSATNHSTVSLAAKQIIEAVYNKISSGEFYSPFGPSNIPFLMLVHLIIRLSESGSANLPILYKGGKSL